MAIVASLLAADVNRARRPRCNTTAAAAGGRGRVRRARIVRPRDTIHPAEAQVTDECLEGSRGEVEVVACAACATISDRRPDGLAVVCGEKVNGLASSLGE
jgi:hypothetical protein